MSEPSEPSEPDAMTSPTLAALLRSAVSTAHPEIAIEGRDKTAILEDVMTTHGTAAVMAIGAQLRSLTDHPVVRALVAAPSPTALLERWMLLERFGHTRHRTELVGPAGPRHLALRHVALDGSAIARGDDLFVWGLLVALLEQAGTRGLSASLGLPDEPGVSLVPAPGVPAPELPAHTHVVTFRWSSTAEAERASPRDVAALPTSVGARLHALFARDLLAPWTARDAARTLGLSTRSLQRALQSEGTSFSKTLQQARVATAEALLGDPRISLSEVAFCTGFADHAHFTRSFRRLVDVPPSAFRQVLRASVEPELRPAACRTRDRASG